MRLVIFLALFITACIAVKPYYDVSDAPALFEKFIRDYQKTYIDEEDKQIHFEAFVHSLNTINRLNAEVTHATFDINAFADYTKEEREKMYGLLIPPWVEQHNAEN